MKKVLLHILFALPFSGVCQNIMLDWAKQFTGGANSYVYDLCLNGNGEVYCVGRFGGPIDLNPGPGTNSFTSGNGYEPYITKLDAAGNFIWGKAFQALAPTFDQSWANSVALDNTGNVYVSGYFTNILDFDPGPATFTMDPLAGMVYICKLTANGQFVWAKQLANGNINSAQSSGNIAIDSQNNVVIAGSFSVTGDFDPGPLQYTMSSYGFADCFVCKLDNNGNFLWANQFGGTAGEGFTAVYCDNNDDVLFGMRFQQVSDFDPGPGTYTMSATNGIGALVKLSASGNLIFAKQNQGYGVQQIVTDASNNIYVVDAFTGTANISFGPSSQIYFANGASDAVLMKLNSSGNYIWSIAYGGTGQDGVKTLALDPSGNIFVSGSFQLMVDFDAGPGVSTLNAKANGDAYVMKLTNNGNFLWVRQLQSAVISSPQKICTTAFNDVFLGGYFKQEADFDCGPGIYTLTTHPNANHAEGFVAHYLRCTPPEPPTLSAGSRTACGTSVFTLSAMGSGTINWSNAAGSNSFIAMGPVLTTQTLAPGTYSYYASSISNCAEGLQSTAVIFTVFPYPALSVLQSTSTVCAGDTVTLTASGASSYTWNGNVAGNQLTLTPLQTVTVSLKAVDTNGCNSLITHPLIVSECNTGIADHKSFVFQIFPNPADDYFRLIQRNNGTESTPFTITDLTGRTVRSGIITGTETAIATSLLKPGVYIVTVHSATSQPQRAKLVIER